MSLTVIEVSPAYYVTDGDEPLVFDVTQHMRTLLGNNVWERDFDYGYRGALQSIKPPFVESITIEISPLRDWRSCGDLRSVVRNACGVFPENSVLQQVCRSDRNFVVKRLQLATDVQLPGDQYDEHFQSAYFQGSALMLEIDSLFKATIQLLEPTAFIPMSLSRKNLGSGGLRFIQDQSGTTRFELSDSWTHYYPGICSRSNANEFAVFLKTLTSIWHFNLWPIYRYLRAIHIATEMEDMLQLLFALEGVFEKNASTELIRVACARIMSVSIERAKVVDEIVKTAFRIRNEIVHGGIATSGYDMIKLGGREQSAQQLFWSLREIVSHVIRKAIVKLQNTNGMRNLRLTFDDVLSIIFVERLDLNQASAVRQ